MSLAILGIGTATPSYSVGQEEAAELAESLCCQTDEQARFLRTLYKGMHIRQRNSVLLKERQNSSSASASRFLKPEIGRGPSTRERMERYAEEALPLTLTAANQAITVSGVAANQITHLITVSCTGFAAPGVDVGLIKELGLSLTVGRTHIGFMGCHGALNGLRVASSFIEADPGAKVLLSAVELCSLHFYYGWDPGKVVANGLFADGSAALVAASSGDGERELCRVKANGSCLFPDSEDAMTWRIGNHGFEMSLSRELPDLISTRLRPWLESWLGEQGLRLKEVQSWAIHPGGPRILDAVQESLKLAAETTRASREVLARYGNMSSPTVLFIIDCLQREKAPVPCVALGFGPGLACETALIV